MTALFPCQTPKFRALLPAGTFVLGVACSAAWLHSKTSSQPEPTGFSVTPAADAHAPGLTALDNHAAPSPRSQRINQLLAAHSHQRTPARLSPDQIATSQDGD